MNKEQVEFLTKCINEAPTEADKLIYKDVLSTVLLNGNKGNEEYKDVITPSPAVDPVEQVTANRVREEELLAKAREGLELESFIKTFDTEYKMLIPEANKITDINKADMEGKHKTIRKVKVILENKNNYDILPLSQKNVADKILNTNLTNETELDLREAKILISDLQGIKQERLLSDAKINPVSNTQEISSVEKDFMRRNVIKKPAI